MIVIGGEAIGGDVYAVCGLETRGKGANASEARVEALSQGHKEAFDRVVGRLTSRVGELSVDGASAGGMATSFSVSQEKFLDTGYSGVLSVRFDPAQVRAVLSSAGFSFSDQQRAPILLLLVEGGGLGERLWGRHGWRRAWEDCDLTNGTVPFLIPEGDLEERGLATASGVMAIGGGGAVGVEKLARRYGVSLVLSLRARALGGGAVVVDMVLRDGKREDVGVFYVGEGGYEEAVRRVRRMFEQPWRARTLVNQDETSVLRVTVRFSRYGEWGAIRSALSATPTLESWRVRELSTIHAVLDVFALGSTGSLRALLSARGLSLDEGEGGWVLELGVDDSGEGDEGR